MDKLKDLELNKLVAYKLGYSIRDTSGSGLLMNPHKWDDGKPWHTSTYDYCNNWGDTGPIIGEYRIELTYLTKDETWEAAAYNRSVIWIAVDDNPLRAVCLCFLDIKLCTTTQNADCLMSS